jgi:hypothetical protein
MSTASHEGEIAAGFVARLVSGFLAWLAWPFRPSPLDLVKQGNAEPYLMMRNITDAATGQPLVARWYRVGVVNRSRTDIDDVQVQAWRMNPPGFAGLPQALHLMNDNPTPPEPYQQTFTVAPDRGPSQYVDVVVKVVNQPLLQLQHITAGVSQHFPVPAGRYHFTLRVSGLGTRARLKHFVLDLDATGELRFEPA